MKTSRLKKVIVTEFNLKYQINKSLNRCRANKIRLMARWNIPFRRRMVSENNKRYSTVQLGKYGNLHYLMYNGVISTGGFSTRRKAMQWFLKDGR